MRLSNHYGKKVAKNHDDLITMFMEAKSVENADYVLSPSQFYLNWWSDYANFDKSSSMAINNITKKEVSIVSSNPGKKYSVTFFGRLEVLKGLDLFINAILYMKKHQDSNESYRELLSNLEINFIGNSVSIYGQKSEDFIKVRCAEIIDQVSIHTDFDTKKAFEFMLEKNSLMVLPTLGETSSCVVSEAICNGVPYLASDIPGIKELVHPELHSTTLFKCGNQNSLIEKLIERIKKPVYGKFRRDMDETISEWEDLILGTHELYNKKKENNKPVSSLPLVSVVIPTYDRYEELEESILSIKNQTYNNIEVIVVDDGSPELDRVKEICTRYQVKFVSSSEKMFKGAACNLGVAKSEGKYVLFFDDDDIMNKTSVSKYVKFLESNEDIDICSGFCSVFENEKYLESGNVEQEYVSLALGKYSSGNLISNYFGKGSFIIRRKSFDSIGGYSKDFSNTHMVDYRFYVKAAVSGLNIHIIPEPMYFYRKNSKGSLYYENANNSIKLFDAKSVIFNTLKEKVDPELHDMFGMLYFNNSYPKATEKKVEKEHIKWFATSQDKVKAIFAANKNGTSNINVHASDQTLLCHASLRLKEKVIILNHKDNGSFQKELRVPVNTENWLCRTSVSLDFQLTEDGLNIESKDLNVKHTYNISHSKQKNIRKLTMGNEFFVA